MSLTYSFETARDLLEKVRRDVGLLDEQVTGDRFFNLVITAYHLLEWIKRDSTIPEAVKDDVASMYNDRYVKVCRDIANASKHFYLRSDYRDRVVDSAESRRAFGCGRFGKGVFGVGEESIGVECDDGTRYTALQISHGVLRAWEAFFSKHSM